MRLRERYGTVTSPGLKKYFRGSCVMKRILPHPRHPHPIPEQGEDDHDRVAQREGDVGIPDGEAAQQLEGAEAVLECILRNGGTCQRFKQPEGVFRLCIQI